MFIQTVRAILYELNTGSIVHPMIVVGLLVVPSSLLLAMLDPIYVSSLSQWLRHPSGSDTISVHSTLA